MAKLLIVDDQAHVRKLVIASVRKKGYCIFEAEDGLEALEIAVREAPDLVILDFRLPHSGIDGGETARRLRGRVETRNCKILMISGFMEMNAARAASLGADDFMTKPFSPIRLRDRIDQLLNAISGNQSLTGESSKIS